MTLRPLFQARFRVALAPTIAFATGGIFAVACGGSTVPSTSGGAHDSGVADVRTHDAPTVDSKVTTSDGGCVASPVVGGACTAGQTACPAGDPCCVGYEWECSTTTHEWTQLGLGCSCQVTPTDAGVDAGGLVPCGDQPCPAGQICVETTSSGGACEMPNDAGVCPGGGTASPGTCCDNTSITFVCSDRPAGCGDALTCGCAASLCECMCSEASGTMVQCACDFP